jgi:hypothetical protein
VDGLTGAGKTSSQRGDAMRVSRLDHLVLTVASIDATVRFYTEVLPASSSTTTSGS